MQMLFRVLALFLCLALAGSAMAGDQGELKTKEKAASPPAGKAIEEIPAMTVMAMVMTGSYEQHGNAIMQLMMYAAPRGCVQGAPFGIYRNSPHEVPADSLRWEVCVPVTTGTAANAPFIVYPMQAFQAATMTCVGPFEKTEQCYEGLLAYIEENGLAIAGSVQEHWLTDPQQVAPEENQTRIVIPVGKKK